jgi:hypothetical protein
MVRTEYGVFRCPSCDFEWAGWVPFLNDPWVTCPYNEHDPHEDAPPQLVTMLTTA